LFIHSDIGRGLLAAKRAGLKMIRGGIEKSLIQFLAGGLKGGEDILLFPAFNYDYAKTRLFNISDDPVQVGAIPEWVRKNLDFQRSPIPFFSFLSKFDLGLSIQSTVNPFGSDSGFQKLYDQDVTIAMFGVGLNRLTFIHYIEEIVGKPVYRYEKDFHGSVVFNGQAKKCEFFMHVRPMGVHLDYDWSRLEKDLLMEGILQVEDYSPDVKWVKARRLGEFWGNRVSEDPFYFLDERSTDYFRKITANGCRRVVREDFEPG